MKREEKQLFMQLCSFRSGKLDEGLLFHATPEVLGHLFFNRMQGIAYGMLKNSGYLGKVNREFRNSLEGAYEQNTEKNKAFFRGLNLLSDVLNECRGQYAMLKGALLCKEYPEGYRTSNDVDLLVRPGDVTVIGEALRRGGFRQGHIRNGDFIPASRKEIIESKMLRGETVPYIFEIGLPCMRFIEVDINFSLDYKNGETDILENMLNNLTEAGDIMTLSKSDFFLHLCCHLYKEAATQPWVEMKRDMTLYKYADIYMLLDGMNDREICRLFKRAEMLGLERICAFAIIQTMKLFDIQKSDALITAENALHGDTDFLHRVISPRDRKTYIYKTKDIAGRFFMSDRAADLEEAKAL